jgi:hypothetical protein
MDSRFQVLDYEEAMFTAYPSQRSGRRSRNIMDATRAVRKTTMSLVRRYNAPCVPRGQRNHHSS